MTDQRSFDDRDGWIWLDGALVPWREANVHVLTHALHYASSVFEGQKAYVGRDLQAQRAQPPAEAQRRRCSASRSPGASRRSTQACRDVLAANELEDAYMRPLAWRGSEQMGVSAQKSKIHLAIACWPWGAYFGEEAIRKGLRLDISQVAPARRPIPRRPNPRRPAST